MTSRPPLIPKLEMMAMMVKEKANARMIVRVTSTRISTQAAT
jgi:hypothetical protein